MSSTKKCGTAIHWFRKGLRLHDNPSLLKACTTSANVYPIYIIDQRFANPDKVGINRYSFLLQSLEDLDASLRSIGSRLYVIQGKPEEQIPLLFAKWDAQLLTYEKDSAPSAVERDSKISKDLIGKGFEVYSFCSHTLFDADHYLGVSKGKPPGTYLSFCKLFESLGKPREPLAAITASQMPPTSRADLSNKEDLVPSLAQMGYVGEVSHKFPGGETEALKRMAEMVTARPKWVKEFQKPETSPNSIEPATTVLSPYLMFGCISPSVFYHELNRIYRTGAHTEPPMSLHGQVRVKVRVRISP
jgi:cryptochrome